ncbi:MAG: S-layer homology domain-containing protein, partial [Deferribacterales bacterium]|nr:S-layer homology domain-containing protein [Deferribacterales bacterium]
MKRTLSLVLALVMVLGMIPVYAQAATPQEEAGKLLEQLGVLKGDQNGNLMLNQTLLRRD